MLITLSVFAQKVNPDIVSFDDKQIQILNDSQQRVTLAQKELEAAISYQENVLLKIHFQLKTSPETHELAIVDKKWAFKKKGVSDTIRTPAEDQIKKKP